MSAKIYRSFTAFVFIGLVASLIAMGSLSAQLRGRSPGGPGSGAPGLGMAGGGVAFIDVHNHLFGLVLVRGGRAESDYGGAARVAIAAMERFNIARMLVMPPPHSPENEHAFDLSAFLKAVRGHRDRFAFLAGGESLNVMIQRAVKRGKTRPQDRAAFAQRAKELLALGALGFGELTAEHFSMSERHIYESAPPDHPLFLLLADIAARHGVPIDIHMEALPEDLPKPARLTSSRNPPVFKANIAAFERLLAHNRKAAIIWSHAGWDNSGQRTRRLMRALLGRHPNLYMSLKVGRDSLGETQPLREGALKDGWRELISDFPNRFLIGSDQFYVTPRAEPRFPHHTTPSRLIVNQLGPELARKVGVENAERLFKLRN